MDRFELHVGDRTDMPLEKEIYERATRRRSPWVRNNAKGQESYFAVCPACDNPIQLINLYKRQDNTAQPYGRHYPGSVPALAQYNQDAYDHCPLATPRQFDSSSRRPEGDPVSLNILKQLIEQFDRVVYLLQQVSGIALSRGLAESMLKRYGAAEGHRYWHAHMLNVPWIFGYMGGSHGLFGRRVFDNEALQVAVETKIPGAVWEDNRLQAAEVNGRKPFLDLTFCYIAYRSKREGDALVECMTLLVSTMPDDRPVSIYEQTLPIETSRWSALLNTPEDFARRPYRDHWAVMAREILDPQHTLAE